jgi:DNA-binding NtrC family response regulator
MTHAPSVPTETQGQQPVLVALVISDSEARSQARALIEAAGHRVVEYATGAAGVQGNGCQPALYLVDIDLPDMSGAEVVRQLKARDADLPVVVSVAGGSLAVAAEALRAGAYDYVTKPWDGELLGHAVRRAAERRELIGNVRQLESRVRDLPSDQDEVPRSASRVVPLRDLERHAIEGALKATNGSVGKAAKLLGIGRATLYRRLASLDLEPRSAS